MSTLAHAVDIALAKGDKGKTIGVSRSKDFGNTPAPVASVDTYGWDTVYAMKFAEINAAIVQTGATPPSFDQKDQPDPYDYRISGSFDPWRLVTGGSGKIVCMELPIPVLDYEDTQTPFTGSYTDVVATIKLRLEDLPQPAGSGSSPFRKKGNVVEIGFPRAGGDVIDSIVLTYNGPTEPDTAAKIRIQTLLEQWLNDNCQDFNMVFASVNLNQEAASGDFDWLMPKFVSYAVRDDIFAVLCMTETATPSPTHDVSPDIIPPGGNSGFLISPERYLSNVVLPNAYLLFDQADPSQFAIRSDGVLENTRELTLSRLETDDGKVFKPKVSAGKFTMRITGSELVFMIEDMRYNIPSTWGDYEVVMTHTSRGVAKLKSDGRLTVDLVSNESDGQIDASLKRRIIEIAVPIVTSIVFALVAYGLAARFATQAIQAGGAAAGGAAAAPATVAGFTPRTWSLIAAIVGLLGTGGWSAYLIVLEEQAKTRGETSPTLKTLLEDAVGTVAWAGGTEYAIRSAALNNGLHIGIQNTPASAVRRDLKEAANA